MKTHPPLHVILAGGSCVALLVYVLACTYGATSFSPDDCQVLYPSFDLRNGAFSVALYDRNTGRSEQIYSSLGTHSGTNVEPSGMHAEWLPDGKHILVAQPVGPDAGNGKDSSFALVVVPRGINEPIRHINPLTNCADCLLMQPFVLTGTKVLINGERSLTCVDWVTGEVLTSTNGIFALPGGDGKTIPGIQGADSSESFLGEINPGTLTFTRRLCITNPVATDSVVDVNPTTREILFTTGDTDKGSEQAIHLIKDGAEQFNRTLTRPGCELKIWDFKAMWNQAPRKSRAFAAYASQTEGQTNWEYGLLEIPLNDQPLRFTPLLHLQRVRGQDELAIISIYAWPGLSHDGRTWAVSTAWLAALGDNAPRPEDCALYLVRVDGARPKITKVPIPLPAAMAADMK